MAKSKLKSRNNPRRRGNEQPAVGDADARRVERRLAPSVADGNNQALPAVAAPESPQPLAVADGNNQALPAVAGTPPRGQQAESPRRSDRVLSSVAESLAASVADDEQRGPAAYPRIVERPTRRDATNEGTKFFWFEIDGVDEDQLPEIRNRIDSRINQVPTRGRTSDVRVMIGDDREVDLPYHQVGAACFKHVFFIYLRNHRSIRGYICCYNLPHPDCNNNPPRDHQSPKTEVISSRKAYTGFMKGGYGAPKTLSSEVKMELLNCLDGEVTSSDEITVVGLSNTNPIVKGLLLDREQLLEGTSPIKVFENNGSCHSLRQKLIHAVQGDLTQFYECVNGGGVEGFTPRVSEILYYDFILLNSFFCNPDIAA